jgi:hypothetical protein
VIDYSKIPRRPACSFKLIVNDPWETALTNTVSYWIDDDFVSAGTPGQPYVLDAATWAKNTEP